MPVRMINDIVTVIKSQSMSTVVAPPYWDRKYGAKVGMAVESMSRHMTDEGWQLFKGLQANQWELAGYSILTAVSGGVFKNLTDVQRILDVVDPTTILVQDKREWVGMTTGPGFDERERYYNVACLRDRHDIFKLTVLKDAHQKPAFHREAADEMGCHAWVVYYHPRLVKHLSPYVREGHLIRTYHSLDSTLVSPYTAEGRHGCLLSGAVSSVYPLRKRLFDNYHQLPDVQLMKHPGYHRNGCQTPFYLRTLSRFKVAICTSSIYGYALRKIIEATACGCIVLTDLPVDEVLPDIDDNLVRITPDFSAARVGGILKELYASYDPKRQAFFAEEAKRYYDYRAVGQRLSNAIEKMRLEYNNG